MKDLTNEQFNGLKALSKNTGPIEQLSIDIHSNGLLRVTIISTLDADWDTVDIILEGIFPTMEYRGEPGQYIDESGKVSELYFIDVDGEPLINLCMKKAPRQRDLDEKEILQNHYTAPELSLEEMLMQEGLIECPS